MKDQNKRFEGKVSVVTGAGGVLCSIIAEALAAEGSSVAVLDIQEDAAEKVVSSIRQTGGKAIAVKVDVTSRACVESACKKVVEAFGTVDILVNGAGGNVQRASTSESQSFFDIPQDALEFVVNMNLIGTIVPCQVFGKVMAEKGEGVILNFSSMNAFRPLTKIPGYSAAKAGVSNFTQWLAVHMAQNYSKKIRVNAVAPGFFITKQTRYLLVNEDGTPSSRGKAVLEHTPMGRFGEPRDLIGTVSYLLSDDSAFVTGVVIPVDGGFSAYSGV
ncbi:SDR family oxidoreductase [Candidatus Bathyarchaeota archaeon]|nr:SDR family oxidoreductase [Candidatus Bathyarchaeota archaeon]